MRRLLLVVALCCAGLRIVHAADSPARLVVGAESIEELLRIPGNLARGRYEAHCEAALSAAGVPQWSECYSLTNTVPDSLRSAAEYAILTSRFVPATHAGRPVAVHLVLMVMVDTTLDAPLVLAVPNNGVDRARYGLLYSAPQRYGNSHFTRIPTPPLETPRRAGAWMNLHIDEHGEVRDSSLTKIGRPPRTWTDSLSEAAKKMTYIPGYHEGNPVPTLYVELWVWP